MPPPRPPPPRPDLHREPCGPFGWLEARLLHEGHLARLGPEGTSVLTLLALAADRHGASFWGRDRMASRLGLTRAHVDEALRRLLTAQLVAHRPWHPGDADGVWQLLPVPAREQRAPGEPTALRDLLAKIGVTPDTRPNRRIPADPGRR